MSRSTTALTLGRRWTLLIFSSVALCALAACGTNTIPGTATPIAPANPTVTELPPAKPTVPLSPTATLQLDAAVRTVTPRVSPVLPPVSVTATPQLGVGTCDGVARPADPAPENCWRGYINGQLVLMKAGTPPVSVEQGIVWIVGAGQDDHAVPWYPAPLRYATTAGYCIPSCNP